MRYTDIYFNGRLLSDLGAIITDPPAYRIAVRELELKPLPHKSGDVIIDKKRYKNLEITYKVTSIPTFGASGEQPFVFALSDWLRSARDYATLRESWCPGYFRRAVCVEIGEAVVECSGVVSCSVTFSADPFLYSDIGTQKLSYNSAVVSESNEVTVTLRNPEPEEAEPVIRIIGDGNFRLYLGDLDIALTGVEDEITLDTPQQDVFDSSGEPYNDVLSGLALPVFAPGVNTLRITGSDSFSAEIIPNWRR